VARRVTAAGAAGSAGVSAAGGVTTGMAVAVAYSGGRDSTALLHATLRAAMALGLQVHALHVHHGLSRHADAWLQHCQRRCRAWAARGWPVQLHHERLQLAPARGDSIEALARTERYAALARMAREQGCSIVLLAHHGEDQAETFLLQALRGAGVAGLSAMPAQAVRGGIAWCRPWLEQPRAAIEAYVRRHRLAWVEDDSNTDARFARNRLRTQVWPALQQAFPDAAHALGDAARWAQDAAACLAALAQADLAAVQEPVAQAQGAPGLAGGEPGYALNIAALFELGAPRGRNALRAWLQSCLGHAAPAALVQRLWLELPQPGPARWPAGPPGELRRYRGRLRWAAAAPPAPAEATPGPDLELQVMQPGTVPVPQWGGTLVVRPVQEGGVALAVLRQLRLRPRQGGEQFQCHAGSTPRSLKKQYQALGVPAWERGGPLVYGGGRLLFVPGLGIDARALAHHGEPQVALAWQQAGAAAERPGHAR
jgi:tRNA(Ile)-lysidine synthase